MDAIRSVGRWTYSSVSQAAKMIAPVVISCAVEAGLQDQRIGRIVAGIGLIGTGLMIVVSSGVTKLTRACCCRRRVSTQTPPEGLKKVVLRVGMATGGLYVVWCGLTQLSLGLDQLLACELKRPENCNLELAQEELMRCPSSRALWKEVEKAGKFTLRCNREPDTHPGSVNLARREIVLYPPVDDLPERRLIKGHATQGVLFELANLKYSSRFLKIYAKICDLEMEEYARQAEIVEWQSFQDTRSITASCVNQGYWPACSLPTEFGLSEEDAIPRYVTLEQHLKIQNDRGHTGYYRSHWAAHCSPDAVYEAIHATYIKGRVWRSKKNDDWFAMREELPCEVRIAQAGNARTCM